MSTTERRFRFLRRRGADGESWHAVQLARHQDRPYTLDYLNRICDDFVELHGDRGEGDDPAIVAGIGSFRGRSVAFVGHQKGRDLKERTYRNFGMASPEGYRKAMRVFELAGRLGFPGCHADRHARGRRPAWARRPAARAAPSPDRS